MSGDRDESLEDLEPYPDEDPVKAFHSVAVPLDEAMDDYEEIEWVVDRLIPKGSLIILAGLPKKSRKSILTMALTLDVVSGDTDFLGRKTAHGPVVFCNLEDGYKRLVRRFHDFGVRKETYAKEYNHRAFLVDDPSKLSIVERYLLTCPDTEEKPVLMVADPLVELELGQGVENENDAAAMARLLRRWRTVAQKSETSIIAVHHFRKAGDTMRGSSALEAACDGWWELKPQKDKPHILFWTLRDSAPGFVEVNIDYEDDIASVSRAGDFKKESEGPDAARETERAESFSVVKEKVCVLLQNATSPISQKKLRAEIKCGEAVMRRVVAELLEDSLVERVTTGTNRGIVWNLQSADTEDLDALLESE